MLKVCKNNVQGNKFWTSAKNIQRRCFNSEDKLDQLASAVKIKSIVDNYDKAIPFRKMPGPSSLPILGTLHHFLPGGRFQNAVLDDMLPALRSEYGDIVRMAGLPGKADFVFVFDPNDIERVYRTEGTWPHRPGADTLVYYREKIRPDIFGEVLGIAPSQGEQWAKMRKQINPVMMQPRVTNQYQGVVDETSREFINRIRYVVDKNGVTPDNFAEEINKWSLESIARIALDTKLRILSDDLTEDSPPKQMMLAVREFLTLNYELDFEPSVWRIIGTPKLARFVKVMEILTDNAVKYVDKAIANFEKNPTEESGREPSVLEKLYRIDKKVAYVMAIDMLIAAVDTTSIGTTIVLYHLAVNPQKQEILRKEITDLIPNKDDPLTHNHLLQLPYLRAAIKESARIKPVVMGNSRRAINDSVLHGYQIPKGTDLVLPHALISMDPTNFPKPDQFIPERWLRRPKDSGSVPNGCPAKHNMDSVPSSKEAHPFAFMPFGFGARMCVGKRFADLEMSTLICNIVRNFQIGWASDELKFTSQSVSFPIGPLKYKFTEI